MCFVDRLGQRRCLLLAFLEMGGTSCGDGDEVGGNWDGLGGEVGYSPVVMGMGGYLLGGC